LKASIETKLKGVYARRARLLAEEQEEQTEATAPTPSVQRNNTRPGGAGAKETLPRALKPPKSHQLTVSSIVRHRTAS
jgi:hypothetical protein